MEGEMGWCIVARRGCFWVSKEEGECRLMEIVWAEYGKRRGCCIGVT